jgi:hypothetical protein
MRKKVSTFLSVGCVLSMMCLARLQAQTAANPSVAPDASAANQTPARQAPDDVLKALSDLVHAGKYAEAHQLVVGLLAAYHDDQRLIKAKALLDTLPATAGSTNAPPSNRQPATTGAPIQLVATMNGEELTALERVDYNALIELARQAEQNTDLEEQKTSLKQFMDQSIPFLQKHPTDTLLWQLRAASAISLNDPMAGYEAGQRLLALSAADSIDSNVQRSLVQLKNKDWLDKQGAERATEFKTLRSVELRLAFGTWKSSIVHMQFRTTMTVTVGGLGDNKEPVGIRLENSSPNKCRLDGGDTQTFTIKPREAAGGTYTTIRTVVLRQGLSSETPQCTINGSVVDDTGKAISLVKIRNY